MHFDEEIVDLFQRCAAEMFGGQSAFYLLHYTSGKDKLLELSTKYFTVNYLENEASKLLCDKLATILAALNIDPPKGEAYASTIEATRSKRGGGLTNSILYDLYVDMRLPFPETKDLKNGFKVKEWKPNDWHVFSDNVSNNTSKPNAVTFQTIVETALFASLLVNVTRVGRLLEKIHQGVQAGSSDTAEKELRALFESEDRRLYTAKVVDDHAGRRGLINLIAVIPRTKASDERLHELSSLLRLAARAAGWKSQNTARFDESLNERRGATFGGLKGIGDNLIGAALIQECSQHHDLKRLDDLLKEGSGDVLQLLFPDCDGFEVIKDAIGKLGVQTESFSRSILQKRLKGMFVGSAGRNRRSRLIAEVGNPPQNRKQSLGDLWKRS